MKIRIQGYSIQLVETNGFELLGKILRENQSSIDNTYKAGIFCFSKEKLFGGWITFPLEFEVVFEVKNYARRKIGKYFVIEMFLADILDLIHIAYQLFNNINNWTLPFDLKIDPFNVRIFNTITKDINEFMDQTHIILLSKNQTDKYYGQKLLNRINYYREMISDPMLPGPLKDFFENNYYFQKLDDLEHQYLTISDKSFDSFLELQEKGQYQLIVKKLENVVSSIQESWILIDAYLELGQIYKAEDVLTQWQGKIIDYRDNVRFWYYRGRGMLLRDILKGAILALVNAIDIMQKEQDTFLEPHVRIELARAYIRQGETKNAHDELDQAINKLNASTENETLALAIYWTANVFSTEGSMQQALDSHNLALSMRERLLNPNKIGESLNEIAQIYYRQGKIADAQSMHERALSMFKQSGNQISLALTMNHLGFIYHDQGRLNDALQSYGQALKIIESLNNPREIAATEQNIGMIYYDQANYKEALEHLEWAFELWLQVGSAIDIAEGIFNISRALASINSLNEQNPLFQQFPTPPYDAIVAAYRHMLDALFVYQKNQFENAEEHLEKALITEGLKFRYKILSYENLAEIALTRWKYDKTEVNLNVLEQRLNDWEKLVELNFLSASLCKVYLLYAALSQLRALYEETGYYLKKTLSLAEERGLPLYKRLALKQLEDLDFKKNNVKKPSPRISETDQVEVMSLYLKTITKLFQENEL